MIIEISTATASVRRRIRDLLMASPVTVVSETTPVLPAASPPTLWFKASTGALSLWVEPSWVVLSATAGAVAGASWCVPKLKLTVPGGGVLSITLSGHDLAGDGVEFGNIPPLLYAGMDVETGTQMWSSNGLHVPGLLDDEWFAAGTYATGVSFIVVFRDQVSVAEWSGTSSDDVTPLDAAGWNLVSGDGVPSLAAGDLSAEVSVFLDYFPPGTDPESQWNISIPARDATLPWWWGSTTDASPLHYTVYAEAGRWRVLAHGSGVVMGHPDETPSATTAPWAAEFSMVWNGEAFEAVAGHPDMGGSAQVFPATLATFTSAGYLGAKRLIVGSGEVKGEIREDLLRIKDFLSIYIGDIITENLTANRTYVLPNNDGVFAMTSDLHNAVTVTGTGISLSGQQISLDIGTGATQIAAGNHTHSGVYQPVLSSYSTISGLSGYPTAFPTNSSNVTDATNTGTLVLFGNEKVVKWSTYGGLTGTSFKAASVSANIELGATNITATNIGWTQSLAFTPGASNYTATLPGKTGTLAMLEGPQTFTGQNEYTGQTAATPNSGMTRNLVSAAFAMSPRVHQIIPFGSGTVVGSGVTVGAPQTGVTLLTIASVSNASARVKLCDDFGFADVNAGETFGFSMPFALRVPLAFAGLDGATATYVIRVYACTQGTMTLPSAGSDPYPANARGICAEIRQKSGGTGFEARLCARDGTASVVGTAVASAWAEISASNSNKHYDLVLASDGAGNAALYVATFAMASGQSPASWHGAAVATLSGIGVPSTNANVATFWSRPEVAVVGDGVAVTGGTRYIKLFQCTAVYG